MPDEITPPRQLTDLYGDPVAEQHDDDEYWEAYTPPRGEETPGEQHRLFVAYYTREGDAWVKQGLDRHELKNLFNTGTWPTN